MLKTYYTMKNLSTLITFIIREKYKIASLMEILNTINIKGNRKSINGNRVQTGLNGGFKKHL
jgi:hypothetical protein